MPGLAQELCALFFVAVVANGRLGFQAQDRVIFPVQIMAIHAGDSFDIVHTAGPVKPLTAFVTAKAGSILIFHRGIFAKCDRRRWA